jgi:histidine kinase/tetratricopeptide repeat protein
MVSDFQPASSHDMKKYFLTTLMILSISFQCFSQRRDDDADLAIIDSLEDLLPSLTGTARIDCGVLICQHFHDVAPVGRYKLRNDSIRYYGTMVLNESNALNYKKGVAEGLLILATDSTKEKNIRDAIRLGNEINDDEVLGWAYADSIGLIKDGHNNFAQVINGYKKSNFHYHKAGDLFREMENTVWLSDAQVDRGEYEAAFDGAKKGAKLLRSVRPEFPGTYQDLMYSSTQDICRIYSTAGDYESAMNYLKSAAQYFNSQESTIFSMNLDIADLFCTMGKYDSAMIYWDLNKKERSHWFSNLPNAKLMYATLGDIYLGKKEYDKAIEVLKDCYNTFDTLKKNYYRGYVVFGIMEWSLALAKAYDEKKNYDTALRYAKEGTAIAQLRVLRPYMMQGYEALSSIYHHLGNNDSAYEYLSRYHTIKDSIQNRQLLLRIYSLKKDAEDEKRQAQILLLNKDNKIKQQQLKQEGTFQNFLIAGFLAIVFAGLYIFRNIILKRKNEKLKQEQKEQQWKLKELENENKHVELEKQSAELEMQALRAQMNPHFIFNSLSSINHFILKNESKMASSYLTRFSRLIRMVLINSQKSLITLQDELEMLRIYLDMERLRFRNSFDYFIVFKNEVDTEAVLIPPLILQPFCENALWHGLMHKEGDGHLTIDLRMEDNILQCVIADDGVGREKAKQLKPKSPGVGKSMGLQITTQRIALLNQNKNVQTFYSTEDVVDENRNVIGTKVILKISHKTMEEELV